MRPLILRWKMMLALLVVVVGGASLGSGLHSEGTLHRQFFTYGVTMGQVREIGQLCKSMKAGLHSTSRATRILSRRELARMCPLMLPTKH